MGILVWAGDTQGQVTARCPEFMPLGECSDRYTRFERYKVADALTRRPRCASCQQERPFLGQTDLRVKMMRKRIFRELDLEEAAGWVDDP